MVLDPSVIMTNIAEEARANAYGAVDTAIEISKAIRNVQRKGERSRPDVPVLAARPQPMSLPSSSVHGDDASSSQFSTSIAGSGANQSLFSPPRTTGPPSLALPSISGDLPSEGGDSELLGLGLKGSSSGWDDSMGGTNSAEGESTTEASLKAQKQIKISTMVSDSQLLPPFENEIL